MLHYKGLNANSKRPDDTALDEDSMETIQNHHLLNIERYMLAKKKFEERWDAVSPKSLEEFKRENARYQVIELSV